MNPWDRIKAIAHPVTSRAGHVVRAIGDGIRRIFEAVHDSVARLDPRTRRQHP